MTCSMAFNIRNEVDVQKEMTSNAEKYNKRSQSNGALMRILPIPIELHNSPDMLDLIMFDTKLSHSNEIALECNIVYSLTIKYLLYNNKDVRRNILAIDYALKSYTYSELVKSWVNFTGDITKYSCKENTQWYWRFIV